ncbi:nucleoside phosphorylase [Patescibacteria group bacterium]|nr:nucleoside phosphorylase [Patescibacteria group bacterium]MCL5091319.1 nucleoside phosphorylase [Patescibacteria group bacterium]
MQRQSHILCTKKTVAQACLLPGDPGRAKYIAEKYLSNPVFVAQNREFVTYTGTYKKVKITVTSTGIGSPSTAIAVEELINCGAKLLIRVGTCGGALKKQIKAGAVIIPTAAIREEGTTKEYIAPEFPAVADYQVIQALKNSAQQAGYRYYLGINRTHDAFYGQAQNIKSWGKVYLNPRMKDWNYPLISSEMECAPLFIIGTLRGVMTGAVLAVNSNPEPLKEIMFGKFSFDTPNTKIATSEAEASVDRAILTALGAVVRLSNLS